jgi:hypothetical protein
VHPLAHRPKTPLFGHESEGFDGRRAVVDDIRPALDYLRQSGAAAILVGATGSIGVLRKFDSRVSAGSALFWVQSAKRRRFAGAPAGMPARIRTLRIPPRRCAGLPASSTPS